MHKHLLYISLVLSLTTVFPNTLQAQLSLEEIRIKKKKIYNFLYEQAEPDLEIGLQAYASLQEDLLKHQQEKEAIKIYTEIFYYTILGDDSPEQQFAFLEQTAKDRKQNELFLPIYHGALAHFYLYNAEIDSFDKYYALSEQAFLINQDHEGLSSLYNTIAFELYYVGEPQEAKLIIDKADQDTPKIKDQDLIAAIWSTKALIYAELGEVKIPLQYNLKVLQYYLQDSLVSNYNLSSIYNNLAASYNYLADHSNALLYYQKTLSIDTTIEGLITTHYNIGSTYSDLREYPKSKQHFNQALKYLSQINDLDDYQKQDCINIYMGLIDIYRSENKLDSAIYTIQKVKEYQKEIDYRRELIHNITAKVYIDMKQYDLVQKELKEALRLGRKKYGNKNDFILSIYSISSYSFYQEGKYQDAINQIQKAIEAGSINFSDKKGTSNPLLKDIVYKNHFINILGQKVQAMAELEKTDPKNFKFEDYYQTAILGTTTLEELNRSFKNKASQNTSLNEYAVPVFEQAIRIAIQGYRQTQDKKYLEDAFQLSERNKSMLMRGVLQEDQAKRLGGIPDSLIAKEGELKSNIDKIKKELLDAKLDQDKVTVQNYTDILFDLQSELDALKNIFETKYPNYYQLKYESRVASIGEIQQAISPTTVLVEYFEGRDSIYIFSISKDDEKITVIPKEEEYLNNIKAFQQSLTSISNAINNIEIAYNKFCVLSNYFHNLLLGQNIIQIPTEQMIIIPDGQLSYIPFEVLLQESVPQANKNQANFKNLPYLLFKYRINYNYSATLLLQQKTTKNHTINGKILGMAATYKTPSPICRAERETKIREKLIDLPGALTEVALLSDSYQGLFLSGEAANEANFKENGPKYGILHFAMHGLLNTEQSDFSGLFFSENTSCDQDNLLYSYEIKQQKLNAGLVVLSACETGIGKYQRGEGVVSIGRGFMYAGSPSLLMTLWVLNDQSGAYIIQQFYQNLAEGMEKDEAIRQAKITYLKNTKDNDPASHPFLWAPFIQLGDYSNIPVATKNNSTAYWIGGGVVIIFLLVSIVLWKRKRA